MNGRDFSTRPSDSLEMTDESKDSLDMTNESQGSLEMTVGVRRRTHEKVQYCITALEI